MQDFTSQRDRINHEVRHMTHKPFECNFYKGEFGTPMCPKRNEKYVKTHLLRNAYGLDTYTEGHSQKEMCFAAYKE